MRRWLAGKLVELAWLIGRLAVRVDPESVTVEAVWREVRSDGR